jgi:hypothetical protein
MTEEVLEVADSGEVVIGMEASEEAVIGMEASEEVVIGMAVEVGSEIWEKEVLQEEVLLLGLAEHLK